MVAFRCILLVDTYLSNRYQSTYMLKRNHETYLVNPEVANVGII
jgi:hypothetical protein